MILRSLSASAALVLAGLLGCSSEGDGPQKVSVSGTVTIDGEPLPDGAVLFENPGEPPATLNVQNGTFDGQVPVGERVVRIFAYRKTKPPPTATEPVEDSKENYAPAKYNSDSDMKKTITEEGPNKFEFKITSK